MAKCKYCCFGRKESDEFPTPLIKAKKYGNDYYVGIVANNNPYLYIEADNGGIGLFLDKRFKINYCPMCGRKLREEN